MVFLGEPPSTEVSQGLKCFGYIYLLLITIYSEFVILIPFLFHSCRHHQQGRWQARIGRVAGNKDLYLGTFGEYNLFNLQVY